MLRDSDEFLRVASSAQNSTPDDATRKNPEGRTNTSLALRVLAKGTKFVAHCDSWSTRKIPVCGIGRIATGNSADIFFWYRNLKGRNSASSNSYTKNLMDHVLYYPCGTICKYYSTNVASSNARSQAASSNQTPKTERRKIHTTGAGLCVLRFLAIRPFCCLAGTKHTENRLQSGGGSAGGRRQVDELG